MRERPMASGARWGATVLLVVVAACGAQEPLYGVCESSRDCGESGGEELSCLPAPYGAGETSLCTTSCHQAAVPDALFQELGGVGGCIVDGPACESGCCLIARAERAGELQDLWGYCVPYPPTAQ